MRIQAVSASLILALLVAGQAARLNAQQPAAPGQPATTQPASAQPAPATPNTVPPSTAQPATAQPSAEPAQPAVGLTASAVPQKLVLAEGSDVQLTFDQDLSSKTAAEGDPVEFVLAEDLKVGNVTVAKAGCKAVGEVTNAKKAGMMGKAGELNVRVDYVKVGDVKVRLRGSKGKEGQSGTGAAVALTVLFGPIGLIKHGQNIDIKKGAALKVFVSDDTTLPPVA
jgi:hypothetical protein